jgi:hypothetical protein
MSEPKQSLVLRILAAAGTLAPLFGWPPAAEIDCHLNGTEEKRWRS